MQPKCTDCGIPLTEEDSYWYTYRCEACEGLWHERINAWIAGGDDPEFDELYSVPPR